MMEQELQKVVEQGEGYYVALKRSLNSNFKKEFVAFANASAIQKHIDKLKEKGLLERVGGNRGGYWRAKSGCWKMV